MKKLISCLMVLTLLISMASVFAITGTAAQSSDIDVWDGSVSTSLSGSGTEADPYLIQSGADLAYVAKCVNESGTFDASKGAMFFQEYLELTVNVDLNNIAWTPIGNYGDGSQGGSKFFAGTFDGNGHTISGLNCSTDKTVTNYTPGLFGCLLGTVKNLGIESGTVTVTGNYGGVIATRLIHANAKIENCYNKATIKDGDTATWSICGGIVGFAGAGSITNCVNYGYVDGDTSTGWGSGNNRFGGIVGSATNTTISNCYNLGTVSSGGCRVGGIIGHAYGAMSISFCYASGTVVGTNAQCGVIAGYVTGTSVCSDSYAYTLGHTNSKNAIGVSDSTATQGTITTNTTDTLVVPTASIFEDFLVATTYGATLGAVVEYDDITGYRGETYTAPVKDGFVFAGWFTDARCTTALGEDVKSGAAYAKFVDADALTVNFQVTAGTIASSESTNLRLLTTVESTDLACVGFIITYGEKTLDAKLSTTVYKSVKGSTAADTFTYGPQYFSGVSEYFATYSITDVPTAAFDQTFTVVPTWTTLDGTVVEGVAANVVISASFAG